MAKKTSIKITTALQETLKGRPELKTVYHTADGHHYFHAQKAETGELQIGGKDIVSKMTREEVLSAKGVEEEGSETTEE
jgi:hypothetical protein